MKIFNQEFIELIKSYSLLNYFWYTVNYVKVYYTNKRYKLGIDKQTVKALTASLTGVRKYKGRKLSAIKVTKGYVRSGSYQFEKDVRMSLCSSGLDLRNVTIEEQRRAYNEAKQNSL
jgi:hypothetical protein